MKYMPKCTPRLGGRQDPEEIPDTKIPERQRSQLKFLAQTLSEHHNLNVHDLMFLAGAIEEVARRKRDSMRRSES